MSKTGSVTGRKVRIKVKKVTNTVKQMMDTGKEPQKQVSGKTINDVLMNSAKNKEKEKKENRIIKEFDTLYDMDAKGKTRVWKIGVEWRQDTDNNGASKVYIVTSYGIKDGKIRETTKEVKEGKQKRTVEEQAIMMANRKWLNKQKKDKYRKTLAELSKKATYLTIQPMLASKFTFESLKKKRGTNIKLPAFAQPKLDGIRCLVTKNPKTGKIIMKTRNNTILTQFTQITKELEKAMGGEPAGIYLDGELYSHSLEFGQIQGITNTKIFSAEDNKVLSQIEYHMYDYFDTREPKMPYELRLKKLRNLFTVDGDAIDTEKVPLYKRNPNILKHLKLTETVEVKTAEDIRLTFKRYVKDGYEGIMLRNKHGPYQPNKRSKYLQKYKEFVDDEFTIVGFAEGQGDDKGTVIWICETKDKKHTFRVKPMGSRAKRRSWFKNGKKFIGSKLTVEFQEYSDDMIPRFPVGKGIRTDL